jgi:hypothetical protein
MPGYANLFDRLFETQSALAIAHRCDSPGAVIELGHAGLRQHLREKKIAHRAPTIDKVLTWAAQAVHDNIQDGPLHIQDGPLHHAIWTDLHELYQCF